MKVIDGYNKESIKYKYQIQYTYIHDPNEVMKLRKNMKKSN